MNEFIFEFRKFQISWFILINNLFQYLNDSNQIKHIKYFVVAAEHLFTIDYSQQKMNTGDNI